MTKGGRKGPPASRKQPKQSEPAEPPPYEIVLEDEAKSDLRTLDPKTRRIVGDHILKDLAQPYQAQNVKKVGAGYRLKVGDFRVFYVVDDKDRIVGVTNVVRRGPGTYR